MTRSRPHGTLILTDLLVLLTHSKVSLTQIKIISGLDMVADAYGPSCLGAGGRRITVQCQPWKKTQDPI
jgi:hypothetical protein